MGVVSKRCLLPEPLIQDFDLDDINLNTQKANSQVLQDLISMGYGGQQTHPLTKGYVGFANPARPINRGSRIIRGFREQVRRPSQTAWFQYPVMAAKKAVEWV